MKVGCGGEGGVGWWKWDGEGGVVKVGRWSEIGFRSCSPNK